MPRKGYRSITVTEKVFKYFKTDYEKQKDQLALKGVRSFSGYVTKRLMELMEQEKQRSQ